ncbi:MAG: hypothetical protein EOM50_18185, partial [Erysipelotrichia bacterium]|nr:hypothetical protein [Erysipelotrichia bacterium]
MKNKLLKLKNFLTTLTKKQKIVGVVCITFILIGSLVILVGSNKEASVNSARESSKSKKLDQHLKADKIQKAKSDEQAKNKAKVEADKKAEAKAKAGSDAKAKEEADKKAQEQAQVVAQQQAQAEQQAQAQAVAQQQQQAQAVAEQSQAQATEQAQAVAPPQQAPQQTPPAQQQPPQYIDWSQAGRDKTEYNASQNVRYMLFLQVKGRRVQSLDSMGAIIENIISVNGELEDFSEALIGTASTGLILEIQGEESEYVAHLPAGLLSATDYTRANGTM